MPKTSAARLCVSTAVDDFTCTVCWLETCAVMVKTPMRPPRNLFSWSNVHRQAGLRAQGGKSYTLLDSPGLRLPEPDPDYSRSDPVALANLDLVTDAGAAMESDKSIQIRTLPHFPIIPSRGTRQQMDITNNPFISKGIQGCERCRRQYWLLSTLPLERNRITSASNAVSSWFSVDSYNSLRKSR